MAIRDISVDDGGASISFEGKYPAFKLTASMSDLSETGSAINFEPVETIGYEMDLERNIIQWARNVPIVLTLSVMPLSDLHKKLCNMIVASRDTQFDYGAEFTKVVITYANGVRFEFSNGCLVSGLLGINASGENKMEPVTYRFIFKTGKRVYK